MSDIAGQIEEIEAEIRETPYHKGTERHIGLLRARLSKLKEKIYLTEKRDKGGGGGYSVKKQGDATIVLVGPPSVGKSTLLNALTNAKSKIAPYDFTTVSVIPGMMEYKGAKIQILDVPGLIEGAEEGKGRGREVLSVARGSDLLIIMCDVERADCFENVTNSLERVGIRINQLPPQVTIEKKVKGGIIIHSNVKQNTAIRTIKEVAQELGIKNAEITIREKLTLDQIIDTFSKNKAYINAIFIVNKADLLHPRIDELIHRYRPVVISALKGKGLDILKETIWLELEFVRVYLVRPGDEPNFNHPVIMKIGQTLLGVAEKVGSEFAEEKKRAKIWGPGSKYPGQEVSLSTNVVEDMQVRFV